MQITKRLSDARGVSLLELLLVLLVIGIVSSVTIVNFRTSKRSISLTDATRILAAYSDKARIDSIRRHGGASLNINSSSSYTVNIDANGFGTTTATTINLPPQMTLSYSVPPSTASINPAITPVTIAYDWRGRTANTVIVTLTDTASDAPPSTVVLGQGGDVSAESTVTGPVVTPTPVNTTVSTVTGIKTMQ
jgi:prepilin-type N-terminal cleavage/methylation domain-containing protein